MRPLPLHAAVVLLIMAACTPAPAPAPEPEADAAPMGDVAAVDAVRAAYVEHFNQGHAGMVADLFAEDGMTLFADGGVNLGREGILAATTASLADNPVLQINAADTMVIGDRAVQRGSYSLAMTPEGADPVNTSGYYMTGFRNIDGDWKITVVISNYDAAPPAGLPPGAQPAEPKEELVDTPLTELYTAYAEHFNAGHAAGVAELYAEDAVAAFAGRPLAEGRAAIEAALTERMAAGSPQAIIHQRGGADLGDGWYVGGGSYEITTTTDAGPTTVQGHWASLSRSTADGGTLLHWVVTNVVPSGA